MKWFTSRRDSNQPPKPESSSRGPGLELPGWRVVERGIGKRVWLDQDGDSLSLNRMDSVWEIHKLPDQNAVRQYCRKFAENMNTGLVEANIVESPYEQSVMFIYKRLKRPAFSYTGMLSTCTTKKSWIWAMTANERGTTGVREALVAGLLFQSGRLTIEDYEATWARDPYDPAYAGVDKRTLHYISDDEAFDELLPQNPLSKIRRQLRSVLAMKFDEGVLD